MFCQNCGVEVSDQGRFCSGCGSELATQQSGPQEADGVNAEEKVPFDRSEYYEAAVGYKNAEYYVSRFKRFDEQGVKASWNWPSFFLSFYWLLYRKMWGWGALYFLSPYILGFAFVLLSMAWEGAILFYAPTYIAATFILLPMYANAIYYSRIRKIISKAQASSDHREGQLRRVAAEGGVGVAAAIVLLIASPILLIGVLSAISIPAYNDYILRAGLSEGLISAQAYKSEVEKYAQAHGEFPNSADFTGGKVPPISAVVGSINIVPNGVIVITFTGATEVEGKSVALVPSVNDFGVISWECRGIDVESKYLPAMCRN